MLQPIPADNGKPTMTEDNKKDAGRKAAEQAAAYEGVFAPKLLELDNGQTITVPPHPNLRLFDDDRLADYEALLFETESYDRGPDIYIPEQKANDRSGNEITLPAETHPGPLLVPYRRTVGEATELIKPPHAVRVVRAVLGEDDYQLLRDGGKSAADVWRIWNEQGLKITDRADADPKSAGGAEDLADSPAGAGE